MSDMRLIQGDCLEVMDELIEEGVKVDCIITDPPYLHVKGGMKNKKMKGSYSPKSFMNKKMRDFDEKQIYEFLNISKKIFINSFNGYFFCSKLQLVSYLKWAQENKLKYDLLIWDRMKNSMISSKFYASDIDYIVRIYGKKQALNKIMGENGKANREYYSKIQVFKKPKNFGHETEKPLELISRYIELSSNENDIILDPFMGSGTTGVACKNLNRNFIGIELDEKYFEIAKDRIENTIVENKESDTIGL